MNITVVGGGRMGLPLACTFGRHGASVTVADIDAQIARSIDAGRCPYEEPGLADIMALLHREGRLHGTTDTTQAASRSEAIVVIVPAHLTPDKHIDLGVLEAASRAIGDGLQPGTLVVYETTVTVGATRRSLMPILEHRSGLVAGEQFKLAYSPERVKANMVLAKLGSTPKVVGGVNAASLADAAAFYRRFLGVAVDEVGSLEAAEMTKLLGMLYRDVNIALVNELAAFCEMAGVDFERVRRAANGDGEASLLMPGVGVGGHCTPVYPYFITRESRRLGLTQRLSEAAREINDAQPARQLDRIAAVWKPLRGQSVHLLGLGFRPGVKVATLSPAFVLRDHLRQRGANVSIEDPYYAPDELRSAGFEPGRVADAGVVILNTAHPEFLAPDFEQWRRAGVEAVLDGRNAWSQSAAEAAGLVYFGIGRSSRLERGGSA